jgi:iron complex outermembrane receptor protein
MLCAFQTGKLFMLPAERSPRCSRTSRRAASTFCVCVGLVLAPAGSAAQQRDSIPADTAVLRLSPIDVSVNRAPRPIERVPAAVTVLDLNDIQFARPGLALDEVLSAVPGVTVQQRYDFSQGVRLSIRGFGARAAFGVRGVRIIADGIPLTMPDGQAALNNLDLSSAGRIEVIRGASSALYGNAAGGVVSIETEVPRTSIVEASAAIGDYGTRGNDLTNLRRGQLKVADRFSRGSYLVNGSYAEVDGYRDYSHMQQALLNGKATLAFGPSSYASFVLNAVHQPDAESPGALPIDSARGRPTMAWPRNVVTGSGKSTTQVQGGLRFVRDADGSRADVSVYGLTRDLENPLTFGVIQLDRTSGGIRGTYEMRSRFSGMNASLILGTDAELLRDDRRERNNVAGVAGDTLRKNQVDGVSAVGPFVQATLQVLPRAELTGGLRYDAVVFRTDDHQLADGDNSGRRTLTALSPRLGATYALTRNAAAYANVGTSFQTPTTTELINAPPAAGEPCCRGGFNTDLDPQHATSYEIGLKGSVGSVVRYDVALYTADLTGELVQFRIPAVEDRDFFRNAGRSRHRGVEMAVDVSPLPRWRLSASYTWTDLRVLEDGQTGVNDGRQIPGVPAHRAFARLARHSTRGLGAEILLEHVGRVFATDANLETAVNPAHTVADLRLSWEHDFGPWRAAPFVAIQNIFDARYYGSLTVNAAAGRYYEPAPPRNILLGVRLPRTPSGTSAAVR